LATSDAGLRVPAGRFSDGYFEAWLSRLAEPQPDLRDDENLHNRAWFVRLTELIRTVLVTRQQRVMGNAPPWWLRRFLGVAHRQRLTVVTLQLRHAS
jgi:hypothetical protein